MSMQSGQILERTALFGLHRELGARMVPFAGFEMPVRYPAGILAEHLYTRTHASLFDVSHMGQVAIRGDRAVAALERLVPADLAALAPGRVRYTMLTTATGGIIDDLMVTNVGKYLFLVVNASRRAEKLDHLRAHLDGCTVEMLDQRSLLALQGPAAASVLAGLAPGADRMPFMSAAPFTIDGSRLAITRGGYTGEDGFEISLPSADAERIAGLLLDHEEVAPAGLGARDSLRLEAGLCLYGNDIDTTTTPVEAGLGWTIGARRRTEGGFLGDEIILAQLKGGAPRRLVGIKPHGRAPARADTEILDQEGAVIGAVTSGTFGPSAGGPVAMGYVMAGNQAVGTELALVVRGTPRPAQVVGLPFVPHRYFKAECD